MTLYYNTALKKLKELRDIFISVAIGATYICGVRLCYQHMAYVELIDGRGAQVVAAILLDEMRRREYGYKRDDSG